MMIAAPRAREPSARLPIADALLVQAALSAGLWLGLAALLA